MKRDYSLQVKQDDGWNNVLGITSPELPSLEFLLARNILDRCESMKTATIYNSSEMFGHKLPRLSDDECKALSLEYRYSYGVIRDGFKVLLNGEVK